MYLYPNPYRIPKRIANRVTMIRTETQSCRAGCGDVESTQYLFMYCSIFGSLWPTVQLWIGVSAYPQNLSDHLLQFTYSSGGSRARRFFLQLIWLLCIWIIWNKRNHKVFRNLERSLPQLLDNVKLYSYWWSKTTSISLVRLLVVHSWWSNPLTC
jgi:hypothetical protein